MVPYVITAIITFVITAVAVWLISAEYHKRVANTKIGNAEEKARDAEEKARKEKFQSELSFVKILMGNTNMSAEEAMKTIGIKPDDFQKYADILLQQ